VRTLVTGATGFVGRYLVRDLVARGHEVVAVVRPSRSLPAEFAELGVEVLRADLRRPSDELAAALRDVDAIVNLAAGTQGSWRAAFDLNVLTAEHLAAAIRAAGWRGRLVHVSSFSVYALNQLPAGALVDERTPLEPEPGRRDDYAWAKRVQERVIDELRADPHGPEVVVVRPGAIYGPGRQFQYRLGRRVGSVVLLLGGRVPMPLNYVENTVSLLATCVEHPRAAGEVFNAVDPDPPRQREYLRAWRRAQPERIRVLPVPLTAMRAVSALLLAAGRRTGGRIRPPGFFDPYMTTPTLRRFRYATGRPTEVLGWTPPVGREEAFARTFRAAS